jgi:hypothetical protein
VHKKKNAWMILNLMEKWLGCAWKCRPGALFKQWSMLVIDTFRCHLSYKIKSRLRDKTSNVVMMPGRMTDQLQLLDVSINKSFKDCIHKHCDALMNKDNHALTLRGKIKRAST